MLSRRAAQLSAQLARRALTSEPALTCVRGAHGGRPDKDVHATTVLCVRKDGQASAGWGIREVRLLLLPPSPQLPPIWVGPILAHPVHLCRWCWWQMDR